MASLKEADRTFLMQLKNRFEQHRQRHPELRWAEVQARIEARPQTLKVLAEMERTGGEPDVVWQAPDGEMVFCDCSVETPSGRRSLCYDRKALLSRKENRPQTSALDVAAEMGVELLDETDYRRLQTLGSFDCKTSSWLLTPERIRALGGALFGDRRYDTVFVYHNGAQSYYAARGFRAKLRV